MSSTTKVAIIGLFAALLAARVVADAVTQNKDTTTTNDASQKAIQELCRNTSHAQTCVDSLSGATNSSDTKTLIQVAFQQMIKQVENLIKQIDDAGPSGKFASCQFWLQRSTEDLQKAVDAVNSVDATTDLTALGYDINNDLSAARTQLNTCIDNFEEQPDRAGEMAQFVKVPRDLTVIGLNGP